MAIEVPTAPKVYTHVYDNFKGVDFTNDSTNVWHRRSPTGTNMLPDASGRPFKRNGWDVLLSNEDICTELSVASCSINKCAYFELAGKDHIVIFTTEGVLFYTYDDSGNGEFTAKSQEVECFSSYDRCFFFEGNGTSAFYIYGNYRIWRYEYSPDFDDGQTPHVIVPVDGFVFHEVTSLVKIPRIMVSTGGNGDGKEYESVNLLTDLASIEYKDYDLLYYYGNDGLNFEFDEATFKADTTNYIECDPTTYEWTYDGVNWNYSAQYVPLRGAPPFPSSAITPYDPQVGDNITVLYGHGFMLPNNIDINTQGTEVRVFVTEANQFDKELPVVDDYNDLATGKCLVVQDESGRSHPMAHIEFYISDTYKQSTSFDGMDTFKVIFPINEISETAKTYSATTPVTLVGEVV